MTDNYRAYVGPENKYDLMAASQFNLMTILGLRESHTLLDIGCGSLRGGRLFIPYLATGHYFGLEPNSWLIEQGMKEHGLSDVKQPQFSDDGNFTLTVFNRTFDFMLAQSIFSHAAQHQIERCLQQARAVMHDKSLFVATFYVGTDSYTGSDWVYPGNVTYRMADMLALIQDAGLRAQQLDWTHANEQTWLAIVCDDANIDIPHVNDAANIELLRSELNALRAWQKRILSHPAMRAVLVAKRIKKRLV